MRRQRDVDPEWDAFWTRRRVAWWHLHRVVNTAATYTRWSWLWRLNNRVAERWTQDYIDWRLAESEKGRTAPRQGPR